VSKLLGTIDKHVRERIEVRACELEGHPFIDIRVYWRVNLKDEWRPSKKGITVRPGQIGPLIEALRKVEGGRKSPPRA